MLIPYCVFFPCIEIFFDSRAFVQIQSADGYFILLTKEGLVNEGEYYTSSEWSILRIQWRILHIQ